MNYLRSKSVHGKSYQHSFGLLNPEIGHYYGFTHIKMIIEMIIARYRHSFEGYARYYTGVI